MVQFWRIYNYAAIISVSSIDLSPGPHFHVETNANSTILLWPKDFEISVCNFSSTDCNVTLLYVLQDCGGTVFVNTSCHDQLITSRNRSNYDSNCHVRESPSCEGPRIVHISFNICECIQKDIRRVNVQFYDDGGEYNRSTSISVSMQGCHNVNISSGWGCNYCTSDADTSCGWGCNCTSAECRNSTASRAYHLKYYVLSVSLFCVLILLWCNNYYSSLHCITAMTQILSMLSFMQQRHTMPLWTYF